MDRLVEKAELPKPTRDSGYGELYAAAQSEVHALSIALSALFKEKSLKILRKMESTNTCTSVALESRSRPYVDQVASASLRADEVMATVTASNYQERSRVRLQRLLAEQILLLPLFYTYKRADPQARYYRRKIKSPMYSTIVGYASELHKEMQSLEPASKAEKSAKGALAELVALAVGNRGDSSSCCLPSRYMSDRKGIDIHQFRYQNPGQAAAYTGIQVKYKGKNEQRSHRQRPGLCFIDGKLLGILQNCEPWNSAQTFTTLEAVQHDLRGEVEVALGSCTVQKGLDAIYSRFSNVTKNTLIDYPDFGLSN